MLGHAPDLRLALHRQRPAGARHQPELEQRDDVRRRDRPHALLRQRGRRGRRGDRRSVPWCEIGGEGTLTIADSTFSDNESQGFFTRGGAIDFDPFTLDDALLEITGSTFSGNAATSGGAIMVGDGGMNVTNSTFTGNRAVAPEDVPNFGDQSPLAFGGAIAIFDRQSEITLIHVTIADNTVEGPGIGGGIHSEFRRSDVLGADFGRLDVSESIVSQNTANGAPSDCSEEVSSLGHNLEGAQTCGFTGEGDQQDTDPQLAALADNGGPTQTRAIAQSSAAFDKAGVTCGAPTDQRGVTRPQFAACDVGAFELAPAAPPPPPRRRLRLRLRRRPRRRRRRCWARRRGAA